MVSSSAGKQRYRSNALEGGRGRREEGMEGRQKHLFQYSSEYLAAMATLLPTNGGLGGYILMFIIMCISTQKTPLC